MVKIKNLQIRFYNPKFYQSTDEQTISLTGWTHVFKQNNFDISL